MIKTNAFGFYLVVIAAVSYSSTIYLSDSTEANATIIDTVGRFITVAHHEHGVRIDKKRVIKIVYDDSAATSPGKTDLKEFVSINTALKKLMAGYAVKIAPVVSGSPVGWQKGPLVGNGDAKAIADFSGRMVPFLSKRQRVKTLSKEGLFFLLSGDRPGPDSCRYVALPFEISVVSKKRTVGVSSFVRLDTAGNFVPAKKGMTLNARETETFVRLKILDLKTETTAFDERLREVDKGLKDSIENKTDTTPGTPGKNSILSIENKLEELLGKAIK